MMEDIQGKEEKPIITESELKATASDVPTNDAGAKAVTNVMEDSIPEEPDPSLNINSAQVDAKAMMEDIEGEELLPKQTESELNSLNVPTKVAGAVVATNAMDDSIPEESDPSLNIDYAEVDAEVQELYRTTMLAAQQGTQSSNSSKNKKQVLICYICDKKFRDIGKLNSHIRIHQGGKPFVCFFCDQGFTHRGNLRSHLRIHTGEKPFKCPMCDQSFAQRGNLETHTRTHTGERPFMCSFCDLSFSRRDSLTSHVRTHTGERPHACKVCDAKFSRKTMLRAHVRFHTGERPFSCKVCNQTFTRRDTLISHARTHTGEKLFSCSVCKREFSHKGSLQRHIRIHAGVKMHACEVCDKKFSERSHVKSHMRIHLGKTPHLCTVCFRDFSKSVEISACNSSVADRLDFVCAGCKAKGSVTEKTSMTDEEGQTESSNDEQNCLDVSAECNTSV